MAYGANFSTSDLGSCCFYLTVYTPYKPYILKGLLMGNTSSNEKVPTPECVGYLGQKS